MKANLFPVGTFVVGVKDVGPLCSRCRTGCSRISLRGRSAKTPLLQSGRSRWTGHGRQEPASRRIRQSIESHEAACNDGCQPRSCPPLPSSRRSWTTLTGSSTHHFGHRKPDRCERWGAQLDGHRNCYAGARRPARASLRAQPPGARRIARVWLVHWRKATAPTPAIKQRDAGVRVREFDGLLQKAHQCCQQAVAVSCNCQQRGYLLHLFLLKAFWRNSGARSAVRCWVATLTSA